MRQFLNGVQGVDVYLIISLFIFLTFFVGVAIWFFKVDKKHIEKMSQIPLEEEKESEK
jgi:cbb3-type cytochrome oxidase subunit 3